jgi:hypothetical protein
MPFTAESLLSSQALFTTTTRVMFVPPPCAVAYFESPDIFANFLDDSNSLVAKNNIPMSVVLVCTTNSRVRDLD